MLTSARIVVIDDKLDHLQGLVNGLHQHGVECLPIHYPYETPHLAKCANLRFLFADLHLMAGGDDAVHFSTIGSLIVEDLKPIGPYFVVLWTEYPDKAKGLKEYLDTRLGNVTTPFDVLALDKSHYYESDTILNSSKLVEDLGNLSERSPQFAAMLEWEDRILEAAGNTIAALMELAKTENTEVGRKTTISKLLYQLASAAVGKTHVDSNRFGAVNEALLPLLADYVSSLGANSSDKIWQSAFDPSKHSQKLSSFEVAKLNRTVHIAIASTNSKGDERGAVIVLPKRYAGENFPLEFGIPEEKAAGDEFFCRTFSNNDERFRWVLVQSQPACDYALARPGPLSYYLGLELPIDSRGNRGNPPESLWRSPPYEHLGVERLLHVSARFPVSISKQEAEGLQPIYRLREQLLGNLSHYVHSYGSRLGILSFR